MEYLGVLCKVLTEIEINGTDFLPVLLLPLSVLFHQRPILIYPYQKDERAKPRNFKKKQSSFLYRAEEYFGIIYVFMVLKHVYSLTDIITLSMTYN